MNDIAGDIVGQRPRDGDGITFTGTWTEFLPIALTNLLLTIVTLGIYRFWAKARERRYLWSRTRIIDDSLEWTGTGGEMFVGFLIVFFVLLPVFFVSQMILQALVIQGQLLAGLLFTLAVYLGIFYLIGVAGFLALRYRLSRTWWHGIRGGSDDGGWSYGGEFVGRMAAGFLTLGLLIPWAMVRLWNARWNKMSFGQQPFSAAATSSGLYLRWLLIYVVPLVGGAFMIGGAGAMIMSGGGEDPSAGGAVAIIFGVLLAYLGFILLSLSFYAAYYRHVIGGTTVAGVRFSFTARTKDWLMLILGNFALVVFTLGFGLLFIGYRNWSFAVRHLEASGAVDLEALLQSRTAATGDAEGLADAFDIGAV